MQNPDVKPHRCPWYVNARNETIDPADQDGIGCPICYPPDGRYRSVQVKENSNMKRIAFIFATTVLAMILASGVAQAAPATYVSGPIGTQVNGWYTGLPTYSATVELDVTGLACSDAAAYPIPISPQTEGKHYVKVMSDANGNVAEYIDNNPTPVGGACTTGAGPYDTALWEGPIWNDWTAPDLTVPNSFPSVQSDTATITGTVSDATSGVASVKVGSVDATLSGGSFSADVSLDYGTNSFTVIVTDHAGHVTKDATSVFRREDATSLNQTLSAPTQPQRQVPSTPAPTVTDSAAPSPTSTATAAPEASPSPTDTLSGQAVGATSAPLSESHNVLVFSIVMAAVIFASAFGYGTMRYLVVRRGREGGKR